MKPVVKKKIIFQLLVVAACLILSSMAVFVVWRIRLANDIDHQLASIHAAGLPTSGEEANTYYTAVPDGQNAAVKMEAAFKLMKNYPDRRSNDVANIRFLSRKEAISQEQLDLIAPYCAMNTVALAEVESAVKLPRSRYPLDLSWGVATPLPHLANLKQLSLVAAYQSILDTKSSATNISTIIGMAGTLDTEPIVISKLFRINLLNFAVQVLEHRLNINSFDDGELKYLSELLAESEKTNQIANGLIGERAMTIQYFRMSYAEMNKLANSDEDSSSDQGGPASPGPQPLIYTVTGFFERDLRFYLQVMQTNIWVEETHQFDFGLVTNIQNQAGIDAHRNLFIISTLLLPAYGSASIREAKNLAQVRTAQTALAIERFRLKNGKFPDNLNELVPQFLSIVPQDPFDSQPLRYHRLDKGYVVYSIGSDGEDNGGRERPADAKSSDRTHYDITFTVER